MRAILIATASVSAENRLRTDALTSTTEHHVNHLHGLAFNVLFAQSPTAGDDCIIFIQNTDDTDLCLEGLWLSVSAACEIYFQIGDDGTRNAATDIVPVNLNSGSGLLADGTFEVGADLDGGAATLAGGAEFNRLIFRAAIDTAHFNFEQDVILKRNGTLTIWCSQAAPTVTGAIVFNYHSPEIG